MDLGCGNGLLVYLLASEGVSGGEGRGGREVKSMALAVSAPQHPGKGIDLQRRKVWQRFEPPAVLEVRGMKGSKEAEMEGCRGLCV